MKRTITAILLVVVLLFSCTYAVTEGTFEEMDQEYEQLLDDWTRTRLIQEIYNNGLRIYPEKSYEDEHAFDAYTVLPDIPDKETGKKYAGVPFLLVGTCIESAGATCYLQLEDGRKISVMFDDYASKTDKYVSWLPMPGKNTKVNMYCTFIRYSEYSDGSNLVFYASVTEYARERAEALGR